jgi:hypothetical protein
MANAILKAFNAMHLAEGYDHKKHQIVVLLGAKVVGQITPSVQGYHKTY